MTSLKGAGWRLGVRPRTMRLARTLLRAPSPFVMVDLLALLDEASDDIAGQPRPEVNEPSAHPTATGPPGSRLLWCGDVMASDDGRPPFDVAAMLQYPSASSYLRFAARGGADTTVREAAIAGQWRIAARTMDSTPWETTDSLVLIELVGHGRSRDAWHNARRRACLRLEGELIWRGHSIGHLIGSGPAIDEIVVTGFPDESAVASATSVIAGVAHDAGIRTWWSYRAVSRELLPELHD